MTKPTEVREPVLDAFPHELTRLKSCGEVLVIRAFDNPLPADAWFTRVRHGDFVFVLPGVGPRHRTPPLRLHQSLDFGGVRVRCVGVEAKRADDLTARDCERAGIDESTGIPASGWHWLMRLEREGRDDG